MTESETSNVDFEHYGIPGMRWGRRKLEEAASPRVASVAREAKAIAGIQGTRLALQKYGHLSVPAAKHGAKIAGKSAKLLLKTGGKGSLRIGKTLLTVGKYTVKGGKVYTKGALKVAKVGFSVAKALR